MAKDYIDREAAANIFSRARSAMRPEDYRTFDEMNTRDLMLLNAEQAIRLLPAADVVEVVRCKDCKHSYDSVGGRCCSHGICVDCIVREDFFCADGAKMEVDGE